MKDARRIIKDPSCHMLPVKPESPTHAADARSRHSNLVDAAALDLEQRLNGQQLQAQRVHTGVVHHVDRYQRALVEHAYRVCHVKHSARGEYLDIPAIRATLSPRSWIGIAR